LFWHYPHYSDQGGMPSGAIRLGEWKLIEFYEDGRLELFNLTTDPGEKRNLAQREAKRARQLHEQLAEWRKSVDAAMPEKNPNYDPARASEGLTGYEPATPAA
jgi:arylsulfatase A-like enzyme